jgi:hypothetical protein
MCDVTVRHEGDEGQPGVTILTGELEDQAVLMGILSLVYDLGYPLLSLAYQGSADQPDLEDG